MRKMISGNKAKILDNFAVDDTGTIVEIGGNVAIESIEQFGKVEYGRLKAGDTLKAGVMYHISKFEATTNTNQFKLVGKVSNLDSASPTTEQEYPDGSYEAGRTGEDVVSNQVSGPGASVLIWSKDEDFREQGGPLMHIYSSMGDPLGGNEFMGEFDFIPSEDQILPETFTANQYTIEGDKFSPFFTEEQYQAILDLIA